jgi:hypothetical protein
VESHYRSNAVRHEEATLGDLRANYRKLSKALTSTGIDISICAHNFKLDIISGRPLIAGRTERLFFNSAYTYIPLTLYPQRGSS